MHRYAITQVPAKMKYLGHGRQLLFEAMHKLKTAFQIVTLDGPMIFLPGKFTDDIRNNKTCTFNGFFERSFFPRYPGFEGNAITLRTNVIKDAVRTKLTQSLGPVSLDLCHCADKEVDDTFGLSDQWQGWEMRKHTQELIAKLSTQVFLGDRSIQNKEWIRITVDYTTDMMLAVRELRLTPALLRPILHWFLPHCYYLRRDRTSARKIIDEEILVRQREKEAALARGEPPSRKSDTIGWVTELSRGESVDISGIQLSLTFAAIHTTSDMVSKTLYYLAADPSLCEAIREEIIHVLTTQGLKKTALTSMRLFDSTMKEVQRLHAPACSRYRNLRGERPANKLFSLTPRWTEADLILHDGTNIPKGNMISILQDRHLDPSVYEQPDNFDAWRYIKLAEKTGDKNHWMFVTTSPNHIGFGHGVYACPGRFFAANEIKIALTFMLLRYDWRIETLEQRLKDGKSPVVYIAETYFLDPKIKIEFRRRTPEIDIMEYA
jgi:hypothetical protein